MKGLYLEIKTILVKRKKDTSKNDYGHLLVLAGSWGMTGAAVLTCKSALRSGAGLVTLGIPEELLPVVAGPVPEVMTLPLPQTKEKTLSLKGYNKIVDFIKKRKISGLAIGPGLTTNSETSRLVIKLLENIDLPVVLDADGINALTKVQCPMSNVQCLKKSKAQIIITPHPGELGRLLGKTAGEIQKDRIGYAKRFAQENGIICILKGHKTVVTNGQNVFINSTGNPGMATAGSGDVLTGILAGLLVQNSSIFNSDMRYAICDLLSIAKVGVHLHGLAGDLAAQEKGEISLIASDIIENLPKVIKQLSN